VGVNTKQLLPNRGKKVVAISEPSFAAALSKHCLKSNFSEEVVAAGAGVVCELNSAKAELFVTHDGILHSLLKIDDLGSFDDLDRLLELFQENQLQFGFHITEVQEVDLTKAISNP
jgi:hypothetical protein